jgi:hypothetical protein
MTTGRINQVSRDHWCLGELFDVPKNSIEPPSHSMSELNSDDSLFIKRCDDRQTTDDFARPCAIIATSDP